MVSSRPSTPKNRLISWWESLNPMYRALTIALTAPLTVLNAWAFSTIFSYFESLFVVLLVAALLAFLLNYPASWLERRGMKRELGAIFVFLTTLFLLLALGVTLVPLAIGQAQQLVARLPEWIDSGQRQLVILNTKVDEIGLQMVNLEGLITLINDRLKGELQSLAGRTLNLALNLTVVTVVRLLDVLLTIVLTFYLLLHCNEIWVSIIDWLPDRFQKPFSATLRLSFQNYFIGQLIIATCLGLGLTSSFLIFKVPFGLLFGLTIGLMALIPFGGTVGIISITLLVALRDIGLALQVLAIALIVQQIVENLIAPRVLGSVTGLNPFWVFISILTGARVGGLLGVVVAVPTAVVIKEALSVIRTVRQHNDHFHDDLPPIVPDKPQISLTTSLGD